jgi:uncharacterized protein YbjQ (UPF0145 family)
MIITTTETLPGRTYEVLGLVEGGTVQTRNVGRDISQGLKGLVGGELGSYTEMMAQARQLATSRMTDQAQALGADAVIGMRYATSAIMQSAAEVIAYGTAVKFLADAE